AGVGPVFTVQGALIDHVGRYLARNVHEVLVSSGGDHFIVSRKRLKLPVSHGAAGGGLSVIVDPTRGPAGVSTTLGKGSLPAHPAREVGHIKGPAHGGGVARTHGRR